MVRNCHLVLHGTIPIQSWRQTVSRTPTRQAAQLTILFLDEICRNLYTTHILSTEPSYWLRWQRIVEEPVCSAGPLLCEAFINASLLKSQSHVPCWVLDGYFIPSYRYFHYFPFLPYHYMQKSILSALGVVYAIQVNSKKNINSSPALQDQTIVNRFSFLLDQDIPTKIFSQCTS